MKRLSNFELLRVVAMCFIVIGHIFMHGLRGEVEYYDWIRIWTISGVNLFVLISGWFNIHLTWKSLLRFLGMVVFYQILSYITVYIVTDSIPVLNVFNVPNPSHNPLYVLISVIFPISSGGGYWFVTSYFVLMLLSPFINIVLNKKSKSVLLLLVVLLYLSIVSGWVFNNGINRDGYNAFHLITIYVLGDCLRRFHIAERRSYIFWATVFVISTIISLPLLASHESKLFRYNNPLVILASISLFCCFVKMNFSSGWINKLSRSMFPCYLIQDGVFGIYLYGVLYQYNKFVWWIVPVYFISIMWAAYLIESLRQKLMTVPINSLASFLEKSVSMHSNTVNK